MDEPGLFEDGETEDVGWPEVELGSCCWAMVFSSACIWMRLLRRVIVSWELGLWGVEPTVVLSVAEFGLLDCGEDANMGVSRKSISNRLSVKKITSYLYPRQEFPLNDVLRSLASEHRSVLSSQVMELPW